jgi:hypothetical protein
VEPRYDFGLHELHWRAGSTSVTFTVRNMRLACFLSNNFTIRTSLHNSCIQYDGPPNILTQSYQFTSNTCKSFLTSVKTEKGHDSSVGIALSYGLDNRGSRARFPAGAESFSLHHRVQNGSGTHPASYPMVPGAFSLLVKRLGRETDQSPSSSGEVKE